MLSVVVAGLLAAGAVVAGDAKMVQESTREIPVAYEVDVFVAGGSTGAVTAAVAAAEAGAKVFLAAPEPYLGEDLCATYRLWLEEGEEPASALAQRLYAESAPPIWIGPSVPFTYEATKPSAPRHPDTDPPSVLCDGKWENAYKQSVDYDGDVDITVDLGEVKALRRVHALVFQRRNDIGVARVRVSGSVDGVQWREVAVLENDARSEDQFIEAPLHLTEEVKGHGRYVRFGVQKQMTAQRVLLGEIIVETADQPEPEGPKLGRIPPTPMQIKRALDQALLDAGVDFLYGCRVTELLRDAGGNLAGVVMANRAGRQAVIAKLLIDATPRAAVARMAGASFEPYPAGTQVFRWVVVGGALQQGEGMTGHKLPSPVQAGPGSAELYDAFEYELHIPMAGSLATDFAAAEQIARDRTWHPAQVAASEVLFQVPPDPMHGRGHMAGAWHGAAKADLGAFQPAEVPNLYVLSGCADVSREAAQALLRPLELMQMGTRIGQAAASSALKAGPPESLQVAGAKAGAAAGGDTRELLNGLRPFETASLLVPSEARGLPVLAEYDVVVVGGGTGGAPAGIAAARQGAKTLVIEYLHGLGGTGTLGLIGKYYHGYRGGFTQEIDVGVSAMDGEPDKPSGGWNVEWKMEWYRRELRQAGADIWFGTLGCGAVVEDGRVTGVIVATLEGRGAMLAKVVIDATGNADVAAAAGAACIYTDGSHVAVQGTGMPPRQPGANYTNTDYTITDDSDMIDQWRTFVVGKAKYARSYDLAQVIDSRERRRIVGDFVISPLDIFNGRCYPDSVGFSSSNFDTHGFTVHPLFSLHPPDKEEVTAFTPYRSLLPKGLDGILVLGLGISAHRDAMPILRMQPDIQNQGYAAGVAAAMSVKDDVPLRGIDIKALQRHLLEKGNLPEQVLTDQDSYPYPEEKLAAAVGSVGQDYSGLGIVLSDPQRALPLLRGAYGATSDGSAKLVYAHILGMLGDAAGAEILTAQVVSMQWDAGWTFTGGGQYGASLSPLDSYIMALGYAKALEALEPILDKTAQLDANSEFSHHRAVAVALERLGDARAAEPLADLLRKPGIAGHAYTHIETAIQGALTPNPNAQRDLSLRELILARALYRCGDHEGLGRRILEDYAKDLRGHHARHAQAVLAGCR